MASGFFVLLDDIATLMNDVATMGKIAGKKTAGILGDDLAVNAEKSSGFVSERELPVLLAIGKGSLVNKIIILPLAFLLSYFLPLSIPFILLIGACYLAYEGVEKIIEWIIPHKEKHNQHLKPSKQELVTEESKIKSAIFTDFILSVEIIVIALGTVAEQKIGIQIIIVSIVALLATIGVYGIVALIVRMDDFGFKLIEKGTKYKLRLTKNIGHILVKAMPWLIKIIAIIGTIALILVSGGLFIHNINYVHHLVEPVPAFLQELLVGFVGGLLVLFVRKSVSFIILKIKK